MAPLPPKDLIADAIEGVKIRDEKPRDYLGYSGMGHQCQRLLKLQLHWVTKRWHQPRVERIFRRGDYEEEVIAADFERIGIKLFDDQLEVIGGHGYAKGHIDGKVTNIPGHDGEIMLFEAKTMNDKRFKEYLKVGLRQCSPVYYGQIMSYMGKLGLTKCLYVVANKNDEHRNYQIMDFDVAEYKRLEDIASAIPLTDTLPEKIGGKTWFACKFCDAKDFCHNNAKPRVTRRTCTYVTLEGDGKWGCSKHDMSFLSYDNQLEACPDYDVDEMFYG